MHRVLGIAVFFLIAAIVATTRVVTITQTDVHELQTRIKIIEHAQKGDFIVCASDRGAEILLVTHHNTGYYTLVPSDDFSKSRSFDVVTLAHECKGGVELLSDQYPAYLSTLTLFVRGGGV